MNKCRCFHLLPLQLYRCRYTLRAAPAARSLTHCHSAGNERTTPLRRILGLSRLYLPCGRRRWRDVEDAVPYRAGACLTRCAHTATHKRTSRETRSDRRPRRTANPIQNAALGRRFHLFPRPYWRTKMPPVGAAFLFIRGASQKPRLFSRRTYRPPQGFFTRPFSAASSPCRNTALGRPRSCAPSQGL